MGQVRRGQVRMGQVRRGRAPKVAPVGHSTPLAALTILKLNLNFTFFLTLFFFGKELGVVKCYRNKDSFRFIKK